MPNVDLCVRACERALCYDLKKYSKEIFELPETNKVVTFRGLSAVDIEEKLKHFKQIVQRSINNRYYENKADPSKIKIDPTSTNNKDGADLIHILPNNEVLNIELKFGSFTDKQIGMVQFVGIFGINVFASSLSVSKRKEWLMIYDSTGDDSEQLERLFNILNEGVEIFNKHLSYNKFTLNHDQQDYMESLLFNNSGDIKNKNQKYIKFILKDNNFTESENLIKNVGFWVVKKVDKLDTNNKRVNIKLNNNVTNIELKFVLNWKNNYKYKGKSLKASLGFGSPSWNIWIS
jgi:hypothetical protein